MFFASAELAHKIKRPFSKSNWNEMWQNSISLLPLVLFVSIIQNSKTFRDNEAI